MITKTLTGMCHSHKVVPDGDNLDEVDDNNLDDEASLVDSLSMPVVSNRTCNIIKKAIALKITIC